MMRLFLCLLLTAAAVAVSCHEDRVVVVSVPESLEGTYSGIYAYSEIDPTGAIDLSVSQPVFFVLGEETYNMTMPDNVPESERQFCDVHGDCERRDNVLTFFESMPGTVVCSRDRDPVGEFALDWIADSLRLYQETRLEDGVRKVKALTLAPTS